RRAADRARHHELRPVARDVFAGRALVGPADAGAASVDARVRRARGRHEDRHGDGHLKFEPATRSQRPRAERVPPPRITLAAEQKQRDDERDQREEQCRKERTSDGRARVAPTRIVLRGSGGARLHMAKVRLAGCAVYAAAGSRAGSTSRRYFPVKLSSTSATCSGVPAAITSPPASPPS